MIIDAHAHIARRLTGFWQPRRYGKVFDQGEERQILPPSFDPPASPAEVLLGYMDHAGVDRTMLVQHHLYGDQNDYVLEAVKTWPDRFLGYIYLGPINRADDPDTLERLIERGMFGLKIEVASTRRLRADFRFDDEHCWRVFERLNQLKRPLAVDLIPSPPADVVALKKMLDTFPNIKLVNCHVGGPPAGDWEGRALLAKHPRAWMDLAALPLLLEREGEYPYPKTQEFIRWSVEQFGADRVMWGSDYPPVLTHYTYKQAVDLVRRNCPFLTPEQRADVLGNAAEKFIKSVI